MCTHTYISTSHRPPPPPDLLHRGWRRACPASHDPQSGCAARGCWRTSERSLSSLAQRPAAAASGFLAGGPSHSQLQPGREGLDRGRWMRQSAELVWYRFKISLEARKISRYTTTATACLKASYHAQCFHCGCVLGNVYVLQCSVTVLLHCSPLGFGARLL